MSRRINQGLGWGIIGPLAVDVNGRTQRTNTSEDGENDGPEHDRLLGSVANQTAVVTIGEPEANRRCSKRLPVGALALIAVLVLSACSGGETIESPPMEAGETTSITTAETTTTGAPTTATESVASPASALEQTWAAVWSAAATTEDGKPTAIAEVESNLSSDALAIVESLFDGDVTREVSNHPVVTDGDDGSMVINDCLYVRPPARVDVANWYQATAVPDDAGGWVIESIELVRASGCVPATVAADVIADYLDFRDANNEFWNPADPEHPRLVETVTGGLLDHTRGLLEEDQLSGWYFTDGDTTYHPEILRVETSTRVIVSDCTSPSPERGFFDAEGVPQEGQATGADQRNLEEVTMVFEDGRWKAEESAGRSDVSCEFAPSVNGVPQV